MTVPVSPVLTIRIFIIRPPFWQHVRPYGEVRLDMGSRISIRGTA